MRGILFSVLAATAAAVACRACAWFARWQTGRQDPIDALIAKNKARSCVGMDKPDWKRFRITPVVERFERRRERMR